MNKLPAIYWIKERDEAMRRARNAAWYSIKSETDGTRRMFAETAHKYVRDAREYNHNAIRS